MPLGERRTRRGGDVCGRSQEEQVGVHRDSWSGCGWTVQPEGELTLSDR